MTKEDANKILKAIEDYENGEYVYTDLFVSLLLPLIKKQLKEINYD